MKINKAELWNTGGGFMVLELKVEQLGSVNYIGIDGECIVGYEREELDGEVFVAYNKQELEEIVGRENAETLLALQCTYRFQ